MNRRAFVQLAGAAAAAFVLDPDRVLWRPGARTYVTAPPGGWWKDGGLWHIPPGYRLEIVHDPAYVSARQHLTELFRDNELHYQALLYGPAPRLALESLERQRTAIREMLLRVHDAHRPTFILVPPPPERI